MTGDVRPTTVQPASTPAPVLLENGMRLKARTGRVYLASNVTNRYRQVTLTPEMIAAAREKGIDKPIGRLNLQTVTVRRELPKIRGKAARAADKKERARVRHQNRNLHVPV